MRILYHHRTLGDGAEGIHVSSIVNALKAGGHDVKVASLIGEQTNVSNNRTRLLTPIVRALPRAAYELAELGYSYVGYRMLSRHVSAWQPDFIYERYTLFNLAGALAARRAGVPLVLEVNAPLAWERARYEKLVLRGFARRCEVRACCGADVVIVVSTPLKEHLVGEGVPAERIVVMPNGADPQVFKPDARAREAIRRRHAIGRDAVVVGFTGILRPWHGVELMIDAVARVRSEGIPVHALVVGDGPSLEGLRARAEAKDVGHAVTFTGRIAHAEMPQYIAAFDIGVSPRATFYASPMKVPEYMSSGVAVIAPAMGNLRDLISDGVDGVLFEPEDLEDLTRALRRLASDQEYRAGLAARARHAIVTGRTWRHNADRIVELGAPSRLCA